MSTPSHPVKELEKVAHPEVATVQTKRFDLAGNSLPRQIIHYLRCRFGIMGNYNTGAGLRCLLTLWVMHYLG